MSDETHKYQHLGNDFFGDGEKFFFANGQVIPAVEALPCVLCHKTSQPCLPCASQGSPWQNDHDPCIGHIDEPLRGLCCGHGDVTRTYIAFADPLKGNWYGADALEKIRDAMNRPSNHTAPFS